MASVDELLGTQDMIRVSSWVHVVEDIHLQKDQSERASALCSRYVLHCASPSTMSSPRMPELLHVHVLILYLNSELIAGVASVHLSAGQVKLPFIKSSAMVGVVGDLE